MSHKLTPHTKLKSNTSINVCVVEIPSSKWSSKESTLKTWKSFSFFISSTERADLSWGRLEMCCSSSSECPQCFADPGSLAHLHLLLSLCSSPWLWPSFPLFPCPAVLTLLCQTVPPTTDHAQSPAEEQLWERALIWLIPRALLAQLWAVSPGTPCTFPQGFCFIHTQLSSPPLQVSEPITCRDHSARGDKLHIL